MMMSYWIEKFKLKDGNNVYYKYDSSLKMWMTVDENDKLIQIVPTENQCNWTQTIEGILSTQYRSKTLKIFLQNCLSKSCLTLKEVLILSPSPSELDIFQNDDKTEKIFITDAHEDYLNTLSLTKKTHKLPSIDLNNLREVEELTFCETIISTMVINYIENPHDLLKTLSQKCKFLILGTWLMLGAVNLTENDLDEKGGFLFDWHSQIGMHCSTRGERWTWTEKYFLNMIQQCGFSILYSERKIRDNGLFVLCTRGDAPHKGFGLVHNADQTLGQNNNV